MERIPAIIICLIFENRLNAISLKFEVRVDRVDFVLGDQDELSGSAMNAYLSNSNPIALMRGQLVFDLPLKAMPIPSTVTGMHSASVSSSSRLTSSISLNSGTTSRCSGRV